VKKEAFIIVDVNEKYYCEEFIDGNGDLHCKTDDIDLALHFESREDVEEYLKYIAYHDFLKEHNPEKIIKVLIEYQISEEYQI